MQKNESLPELEQRLKNGIDVINRARADFYPPAKIKKYEDGWVSIYKKYCAVANELQSIEARDSALQAGRELAIIMFLDARRIDDEKAVA